MRLTSLLTLTIFNTALLIYLTRRTLRTVESAPTKQQLSLKGEFMYVVPADQPAVNYQLAYTATDSEGNVITDAETRVEVASSDEAVVAVSQTDAKSGSISFGSPGLANLNATVKTKDGTLLGSFGAQFTVTAGDVAAISGGSISFEGLTEAPEAPAEEQAVSA
ncbi:MAG: hypothetical protein MSG64_19750 [Pyrinomonadaceae bacterium MAG19_C2-C3]|nr:hypothetical protein [Pyrinomonadaceae bacterium MAG19_C2-C3]